MKKLIVKIIVVLVLLIGVKEVKASATSALIVNKKEISVGEKFEIAVEIKETAAWNIHVTTEGATENCAINEADATSDAKDTEKTFKVECVGKEEGEIEIKLTGDITSEKDGEAVDINGTETVKVNKIESGQKEESTTAKTETEDKKADSPKTGNVIPYSIIIIAVIGYIIFRITNKRNKLSKI